MPDDDDNRVSLWEVMGDPQRVATYWLLNWLSGSNAGLPDLQADSHVSWTVKATGQRFQLTFADLQGQPILTAGLLDHLVRHLADANVAAERTGAKLLSDALRYLARDFESLVSAGRDDAWTFGLLRHYVRVVRDARSLLMVSSPFGGVPPSEDVEGWEGLAPTALLVASRAAVQAGIPASSLPPVPPNCRSYAALETYLERLREALQPAQRAAHPVAARTEVGRKTGVRLTRAQSEEQLRGFLTIADPVERQRRLGLTLEAMAAEAGISERSMRRIAAETTDSVLLRLLADRLSKRGGRRTKPM